MKCAASYAASEEEHHTWPACMWFLTVCLELLASNWVLNICLERKVRRIFILAARLPVQSSPGHLVASERIEKQFHVDLAVDQLSGMFVSSMKTWLK